jgi:hypothetical protein
MLYFLHNNLFCVGLESFKNVYLAYFVINLIHILVFVVVTASPNREQYLQTFTINHVRVD